MRTQIIHHAFQQAPTPAVMLTAPVLSKGRRLLRAAGAVQSGVHTACVFLCGACTAAGILILAYLAVGG